MRAALDAAQQATHPARSEQVRQDHSQNGALTGGCVALTGAGTAAHFAVPRELAAMLTLEGKVAVITGGTSGIGAGTAGLFVEHGARVVIAGRRRDRGEEVARALGQSAVFVRTDVGVEADVKTMIEQSVARFGRLDCLGRGLINARHSLIDAS
jgi:NADPH:quinone reductase-like Zn-dependent oxidoreductase